jgi:conjugal transfer pilus assembly protein TraE
MRLEWLGAELAGSRRALRALLGLLALSMLCTAALAVLAFSLIGRERIVLVPPQIQKSFWVTGEKASAEYLEQMAYFLAQLTLDVTPQSAQYQSQVLLRYAAPEAWGELRAAASAQAERLKRDGASTVFSPQELQVDASAQRVRLRGVLTTFVSERRVSSVTKAYQLELRYSAGRLYLKSFQEISPHDSLQSAGTHPAKPPSVEQADNERRD